MASPPSKFRHPKYLTPEGENEPKCRVRCPVHGFIHFSANERKVIDHRLFSRLRYIKQLALTDFLYPGASHSRFEHSLGVMHLATRIFDRLAERHGSQIEEVVGRVAEFKEDTLAKARQVLRLAALLHDVGHAPFSHAAEKVIHKDGGHEELSIDVVSNEDLLGGKIDKLFFRGCAKKAGEIIKGPPKLAPQLQVLNDIVSGQIDADRTDYLLRDSLHCGVEYGSFDHERLIESLRIAEGDGGTLDIAIDEGGIHTVEALVLARYQMNSQVYYHRTRRIFDYYLGKYFECKGNKMFTPVQNVLEHDDVTTMAMIKRDAQSNGTDASKWAKRIVTRQHHREVFSTGETGSATNIRHSASTADDLRDKHNEIEFVWDCQDKPVSIHKFLLPDDMSEEGNVRLSIFERNKATSRTLGEQSHILKSVPKQFKIARIFADVEAGDIDKRGKLVDFAAKKYREHGGR